MKTIIFYILLSVTLCAQTVYEVSPGTKNNEIYLSIYNESLSAIDKLKATLVNIPKGIDVCNSFVEFAQLQSREEKEALFSFDSKRVPGTSKDTLKFLISDTKGNRWMKEIVIEYSIPKEFRLEQNYPNPFNPTTTIEYSIPQKGRYLILIYNVLGQLVKILTDNEYESGYYKITFDAGIFASGVYIYQLHGENINLSKKMVVMK